MGTKTRYLHLAAATAIALSATPGSPSRSAAIERKSSAAKAASSGHSEGHEAGTVSGTVRVIGAQTDQHGRRSRMFEDSSDADDERGSRH